MNQSARESYLMTEVMTATPQKLQLMLIEGALRNSLRGLDLWEKGEQEAGGEAVLKAQEIVGELVAGVDTTQKDNELVRKVAGVYLFIFRSLMDGYLNSDPEKVRDAVRILEVERETWKELCAKLGTRLVSPSSGGSPTQMTGESFTLDI